MDKYYCYCHELYDWTIKDTQTSSLTPSHSGTLPNNYYTCIIYNYN